jgi:hypothetical protein
MRSGSSITSPSSNKHSAQLTIPDASHPYHTYSPLLAYTTYPCIYIYYYFPLLESVTDCIYPSCCYSLPFLSGLYIWMEAACAGCCCLDPVDQISTPSQLSVFWYRYHCPQLPQAHRLPVWMQCCCTRSRGVSCLARVVINNMQMWMCTNLESGNYIRSTNINSRTIRIAVVGKSRITPWFDGYLSSNGDELYSRSCELTIWESTSRLQ